MWNDTWIESCIAHPERLAAAFATADADGDGVVKGSEAVAFFRGSGASDTVLSYVWRSASKDSYVLATQDELRVAFGLLLEARRGLLPFQGAQRFDAEVGRRAAAVVLAPFLKDRNALPSALNPTQQEQHKRLFDRLAAEDCDYIPAADVKRFATSSGLPDTVIAQVLAVAAGEDDEIDAAQFAGTLHLVLAAMEEGKRLVAAGLGNSPTHRRSTSRTQSSSSRAGQQPSSRAASFSAPDRARLLSKEFPQLIQSVAADGNEVRLQLHNTNLKALMREVGNELLRLSGEDQAGAQGGAQGGSSGLPPTATELNLDAMLRCLGRLRGVEEVLRLALPPPPVPPRVGRHSRSTSGSIQEFTPKRAVPLLPTDRTDSTASSSRPSLTGQQSSAALSGQLPPTDELHDPFIALFTNKIMNKVVHANEGEMPPAEGTPVASTPATAADVSGSAAAAVGATAGLGTATAIAAMSQGGAGQAAVPSVDATHTPAAHAKSPTQPNPAPVPLTAPTPPAAVELVSQPQASAAPDSWASFGSAGAVAPMGAAAVSSPSVHPSAVDAVTFAGAAALPDAWAPNAPAGGATSVSPAVTDVAASRDGAEADVWGPTVPVPVDRVQSAQGTSSNGVATDDPWGMPALSVQPIAGDAFKKPALGDVQLGAAAPAAATFPASQVPAITGSHAAEASAGQQPCSTQLDSLDVQGDSLTAPVDCAAPSAPSWTVEAPSTVSSVKELVATFDKQPESPVQIKVSPRRVTSEGNGVKEGASPEVSSRSAHPGSDGIANPAAGVAFADSSPPSDAVAAATSDSQGMGADVLQGKAGLTVGPAAAAAATAAAAVGSSVGTPAAPASSESLSPTGSVVEHLVTAQEDYGGDQWAAALASTAAPAGTLTSAVDDPWATSAVAPDETAAAAAQFNAFDANADVWTTDSGAPATRTAAEDDPWGSSTLATATSGSNKAGAAAAGSTVGVTAAAGRPHKVEGVGNGVAPTQAADPWGPTGNVAGDKRVAEPAPSQAPGATTAAPAADPWQVSSVGSATAATAALKGEDPWSTSSPAANGAVGAQAAGATRDWDAFGTAAEAAPANEATPADSPSFTQASLAGIEVVAAAMTAAEVAAVVQREPSMNSPNHRRSSSITTPRRNSALQEPGSTTWQQAFDGGIADSHASLQPLASAPVPSAVSPTTDATLTTSRSTVVGVTSVAQDPWGSGSAARSALPPTAAASDPWGTGGGDPWGASPAGASGAPQPTGGAPLGDPWGATDLAPPSSTGAWEGFDRSGAPLDPWGEASTAVVTPPGGSLGGGEGAGVWDTGGSWTSSDHVDSQASPGAQLSPAARMRQLPPVMEAEVAETAAWPAMAVESRERCIKAYQAKYAGKGGVSPADVAGYVRSAKLPQAVAADVWRVCGGEGSMALNCDQFCLVMLCLQQVSAGYAIPARLAASEFHRLLGQPSAGTQPAAAAQRQPGVEQLSPALKDLLGLGFSLAQAQRAMELHGGDMEAAATWLITQMPAERQNSLSATPSSSSAAAPPGGQRGAEASEAKHGRQQSIAAGKTTVLMATGNERAVIDFSNVFLSYKKDMSDPFITLTLRDANGVEMERTQETPPGVYNPKTHVLQLGHSLTLHTPLTNIHPGSVAFIEVRHYKPKERKVSTAAWSYLQATSFMDFDELTPKIKLGALLLPLYQKPVDFTLTKLKRINPKAKELNLSIGVAQGA